MTSSATPARRFTTLIDALVIGLLLLVCALTLSKNATDPDLWGHVRYGADALASGLPAANTYSYTAAGHRWINHEVLSEYAMAWGVQNFGPTSLLIAKCLLGLLILVLVVKRAESRQVGQLATFLVALLVGMNLMHFWSIRPQIFSYVFFAIMIVVLDRAFRGWEGRWRLVLPGRPLDQKSQFAVPSTKQLGLLFTLPLLFFVWANTHGAFVAGWCLMTAYLGCRSIEIVSVLGRRAFPRVTLLATIVLASGLLTFANPYGWELHGWLLESLGSPRPEIVEWRPPDLFGARGLIWLQFWIMAALILVALGYAAYRKQLDLTHGVLVLLTLWQAVEHRRHIPFVSILFGYWFAVHVQTLMTRLRSSETDESIGESLPKAMHPILLGVLVTATAIVSYTLYGQLQMITVRRDCYPVSAFQYMSDHDLQGKLVLRFSWAQYAIAAFGDEHDPAATRVAFDGRFRTCYPQQVVDMYFDFAQGTFESELRHRETRSGEIDGARILKFNEPDLALIDRQQGNMVRELTNQADEWTLLYQDELAQLWGRRDKYDEPTSNDYIPPAHRKITDTPQDGLAAWPAFPNPNQPITRVRHQPSPISTNE